MVVPAKGGGGDAGLGGLLGELALLINGRVEYSQVGPTGRSGPVFS
jgi:hypothetical protein